MTARSGRSTAAHPPGLDLRRQGAGAARLLLRGRGARLTTCMWRCLAPHMPRPAAGRQFRLDLRHLHRRHRIPTPAATSRSSSRSSAAGARSRGRDGNSAIFSGFHGDTFNCPAEIAEARYGLYVDRMALNPEPTAARAATAAARASSSTTASAATTASSPSATRETHPPWALDGGPKARPTTSR